MISAEIKKGPVSESCVLLQMSPLEWVSDYISELVGIVFDEKLGKQLKLNLELYMPEKDISPVKALKSKYAV